MITIICGQLDDGTKNELEISDGYTKAVEDDDLVGILSTDNGGMSFLPCKSTVAVKSLTNFSNAKPSDPYHYKEEFKTKFQATLAMANRFPNGMVYMEEMLRRNVDKAGKEKPLTIENYFKMTAEEKEF